MTNHIISDSVFGADEKTVDNFGDQYTSQLSKTQTKKSAFLHEENIAPKRYSIEEMENLIHATNLIWNNLQHKAKEANYAVMAVFKNTIDYQVFSKIFAYSFTPFDYPSHWESICSDVIEKNKETKELYKNWQKHMEVYANKDVKDLLTVMVLNALSELLGTSPKEAALLTKKTLREHHQLKSYAIWIHTHTFSREIKAFIQALSNALKIAFFYTAEENQDQFVHLLKRSFLKNETKQDDKYRIYRFDMIAPSYDEKDA